MSELHTDSSTTMASMTAEKQPSTIMVTVNLPATDCTATPSYIYQFPERLLPWLEKLYLLSQLCRTFGLRKQSCKSLHIHLAIHCDYHHNSLWLPSQFTVTTITIHHDYHHNSLWLPSQSFLSSKMPTAFRSFTITIKLWFNLMISIKEWLGKEAACGCSQIWGHGKYIQHSRGYFTLERVICLNKY